MFLALPALADDVVAVAPIQGEMEPAARAQAQTALREAVEAFAPLQSATETNGHVEAGVALDLKCTGHDSECWRRIRELAGVDRLIVAVVAGKTLELHLITRAASLDREQPVPFEGTLVVAKARRVVARLLDIRAQLTVLSNVEGAIVELDGRPVGQAPMPEPVGGLKAGEHQLRVYADGYLVEQRTFVVAPGEDVVLQIDLQAEDGGEGDGPGGLFYTGAGLLAGGAVVGIGGATMWALTLADVPAPPGPGPSATEVDAYLDRRAANDGQQALWIGTIAAGAVLAVAGTLLMVVSPGSAE